MTFKVRVVDKSIQPADVQLIPAHTLVSTVQKIEDWVIYNGEEWIPYPVTRKYMEFMAPSNQSMEQHMEICKYGAKVDVRITR